MKTTITIELENDEVLDPTMTIADLILKGGSQPNGSTSQNNSDTESECRALFGVYPLPRDLQLEIGDDKDLFNKKRTFLKEQLGWKPTKVDDKWIWNPVQ